MGGNECFFGHNIAGAVGGRRDEPKVDQKIVIKNRELKMQQLLGRVFSHSLKFFILFPIVITVLWFSKHTRINLLLPASGIVDDVLHNGDTSKFSIRTCWPRVQSDPFWSRFLHNFHWCKKQFSKDKRPSGSDRIIRRQTIQMHHPSQNIVVKVLRKLLNCTCTAPYRYTFSWCLEPVMNRSTRPRFWHILKIEDWKMHAVPEEQKKPFF